MTKYQLFKEIIALSSEKDWDSAVKEWKLKNITYSELPSTCLCGHFPIKELCHLENTTNNNKTVVGNCCVNRFLNIKTNKLFACYKRVIADDEKSFNPNTIKLFHEKEIISDWEKKFYIDTWRKRNLSEKQKFYKKRINKRILEAIGEQK